MSLTWKDFTKLSETIWGLTSCINNFSLKDEMRHEKIRNAAEIYMEMLNTSRFAMYLQTFRKARSKNI